MPKATRSNSNKPSQRARYADLFHRMLEPMFLIHKETFEIIEINEACERLLGATGNLVGKVWTNCFAEDQAQNAEKALRIAKRRYYPHDFEITRPLGAPGLRLHVQACVLQLSDGTEVIQILAKDVTREKEAEQSAIRYLEELQTANSKLEALSSTDEMTQLANFRQFKERLAREHEISVKLSKPYGLLFIDVDHFKHYNDHNGHPAGDALLRQLSQIFNRIVRRTDLPARYGGEEFVILCPNTDENQAQILAERIRAAVEQFPFPQAELQPLGKISVSIGIASFPHHGQTPEQVIEAADHAVYSSKNAGRNRVMIYNPKLKAA